MKWSIKVNRLVEGDTEVVVKVINRVGEQKVGRLRLNIIPGLVSLGRFGDLDEIVARCVVYRLGINPYKVKGLRKELMKVVRDNLP